MTDALFLRDKDRLEILRLLTLHLPSVTAWAYGSRVNGGAHEGSDLDIVLRSPDLSLIPLEDLQNFVRALQDSNIPILVEARDWARLPESFQQEIMKKYVVLRETVSEWNEVELGNYIEIATGYPFKSCDYTESDDGIKLVRGDNVIQGGLRWNGVKKWPRDKTDGLIDYELKVGDVVLAMDRPWIEAGLKYAEIGKNDIPALLVQRVARLRGKKKLHTRFLKYIIGSKSFTNHILSVQTGTAIPHISSTQIKEFTFPLPPLPEQKAIASVLSSLDDKIDLLHRQNKTLEAMAETLFRQWFIEPCRDGLPDGWREVCLNDIVEIKSGFAFKSEIFTTFSKYRLITIKAVQDGYLDLKNSDGIEAIPSRMPSYCFLCEKDILLSLTGNVGRCCIVDANYLLLNQRVAKIHPQLENDRAFSYLFFRMQDTRRQLEEMAKGTAQANLSPIETGNIPIMIPQRTVMDDFSKMATPIFEKIMQNKKKIHTLEKLRDNLLPKLMSGEVRVNYE